MDQTTDVEEICLLVENFIASPVFIYFVLLLLIEKPNLDASFL